ncbi:hypothetical protein [Thomasclavelia spiroformis]|uniref:hypothetical protein n=1 Tax=Thomasclavelia spiroformis TaxID=29348 RepID=UPI0032093740
MSIAEDLVNIIYGDNYRVSYSPTSNTTFETDCEDIVSVTDKGRIYAHNIGTATITAKNGNALDTVIVKVENKDLYGNSYYESYEQSADLDIQPTATFTELHIACEPIEPLRVGQIYSMGAIPYPIDLYGDGTTENIPNYTIDWESSNTEIAIVKYGIITPLKPGETTITAKIHGTSITDSFELTVIEKPQVIENLMRISSNYEYDGHKLQGGTPADAMHAIYGAITEANENGYNGVRFDKMNIYAEPIQLIGISIPSNFIVDFGFSSLYMSEWHDYVNGTLSSGDKTSAYRLFMFTDCENGVIRNLNYYGELYNYYFNKTDDTHLPSEYGEQTLFCHFDNGRYCEIYNVNFEAIIGFNVAVGGTHIHGDYHIGNTAGRTDSNIDYTNFEIGKLKSDGTIDKNETGWVSVSNIVPFNHDYFYPKHQVGTNYNPNLGQLFTRNRFYNIAFYNEDDELIEFHEWRYAFRTYNTPENAVGYRISVPNGGALPTENSSIRGTDFVQRMMAKDTTFCCAMYNCKCGRNFSGICSVVENCENFRFYNNSVQYNGTVNAWEFDIEDCWYEGFGCVVYNNSLSSVCAVSGVWSAWIDNAWTNELYTRRTDGLKILNSPLNYLQYSEGINGVVGKWNSITRKVLSTDYGSYGHINGLEE